jgi:uncharacterized OB-fold protein
LPKQAPVPDENSKPFWDACNEGRLVLQNCKGCAKRSGFNTLQYPPAAVCRRCGSANDLEWLQVSGKGKVKSYAVMYDCRIRTLQADQPFNIAGIQLEDDPSVLMYSHLPGTPVDEVPIGASVQLEFEETSTGQKVPEWRIVA